MSNHRESSCFHTEKLQLHDVSLKAAEAQSGVCSCSALWAQPAPLSASGRHNWAMVLGSVHCLRTADLVLTWNVSDVGKTSVTFNFLVTTSAPVFVPIDPKFLVKGSTQPLQGGPVLLNSQHSEWDFGRQSLRYCWKHLPMSCLIQFSILECLHERGRRKGLPMKITSTNQHGINAAKGMVCLYTHPLMHVNVLNSVRTPKARSYMNLAVTHSLKHYFSFCL